jgi:cysteine-rich repeat protein
MSRSRILFVAGTSLLAACAAGGGESGATATTASSASSSGAAAGGAGATGSTGTGGQTRGPNCGDAVVDADEECDDGNLRADDGCTACVVDCASDEVKDPTSHHCYRSVATPTRWQAAEAECQSWGGSGDLGHLAAIGDATEQGLVEKIDTGLQWIGANDLQTEGSFGWSSGDAWGYTLWAVGEPDDSDGSNDCVIINADGEWRDWDCSAQLGYVCERRAAGK